jgi:hypothetical protein
MHILTIYLPNVADVNACSWQTCPGLEHVLRELHKSGACSSVFKCVRVKKLSSKTQNWYHISLWSTQRAAGVTIGRSMAGQVIQRQLPFWPTALWKLLCDNTPAIGLTMHSDFVVGEELRGLEERTDERDTEKSSCNRHGLWYKV